MGWLGALVMYLCLMLTIVIYINVLPKNEYFLVGTTTLISLVSLCLFSNMIAYTPLSIQLVYPFIFTLLKQMRYG